MRTPRRRRYGTSLRKRRSINIIPHLTLLLVAALVAWLGWRLFQVVAGATSVSSITAEASVNSGVAEVKLAGTEGDTWGRVYDGNFIRTGDTVRTKSGGQVSLDIGGNTVLKLNGDAELVFTELHEEKDGQKSVMLDLKKGQMWAYVSEDLQGEGTPNFQVHLPLSKVSGAGSIIDITTSAESDVVRVLTGAVDVDIEKVSGETRNISVGVSQKAMITKADFAAIQNGKNVLEGVESTFEESEWNLQNLQEFDPQRVEEIRRTIELRSPALVTQKRDPETVSDEDKSELESPQILSPKSGETVAALEDNRVVVTGKAFPGTKQIKVRTDLSSDFYTLTKYESGDAEWVYVIATEYGTLKYGQNTIRAYAVDEKGKQTEIATSAFTYEGAKDGLLTPDAAPAVGDTDALDAPVLKAPVIMTPPSSPFRTANESVAIRGTVDVGTNALEINGVRLKSFTVGQKAFEYTATVRSGTLKQGENTYQIAAYGPGNEIASTKLVVVYTPLETDPVVPTDPEPIPSVTDKTETNTTTTTPPPTEPATEPDSTTRTDPFDALEAQYQDASATE